MADRRLADILFSQGFGTRRECAALIHAGAVAVGGRVHDDPEALLATEGLRLSVGGVEWPFHETALVMLHKPAGVECSQRPRHHPGVLSLLPAPLRRRGVQPVGRLDADTTGLLLLTDDGALIHRLTSPKHHVAKVYEVTTRHPVADDQIARLLAGVVLDDDPKPVRAAAAERRRDAWPSNDLDRRQVPPGQAHAGGGGQSGRGAAPQRVRAAGCCPRDWQRATGGG